MECPVFGGDVFLKWKDEDPEDDKMTIAEFAENVEFGAFMDDDGFGVFGKNGMESSIYLIPSQFVRILETFRDLEFTHVYWYNR